MFFNQRNNSVKILKSNNNSLTISSVILFYLFFVKSLRIFLILSQSEVFAVAFALLAAGAVILTLNVLLLVRALYLPLSLCCEIHKGALKSHDIESNF